MVKALLINMFTDSLKTLNMWMPPWQVKGSPRTNIAREVTATTFKIVSISSSWHKAYLPLVYGDGGLAIDRSMQWWRSQTHQKCWAFGWCFCLWWSSFVTLIMIETVKIWMMFLPLMIVTLHWIWLKWWKWGEVTFPRPVWSAWGRRVPPKPATRLRIIDTKLGIIDRKLANTNLSQSWG